MRAGRAQELREPSEPSTVVEHGFTLIEVLISISILTILIIVVVGGMNTLVIASAINRKQGDIGAVARRAAETVRNDAYVSCNNLPAAVPYSGLPTSTNQLSENFGVTRVALPKIIKITTFDGSTTLWTPASGKQNCSGNSTVNQVVQIEVDSVPAPGITQTVYVVKSP